MARLYSAVFKDIAVTAVQDFFEVLAASTTAIKIHGFLLTQRTEAGDAAEEMLLLTTNRGVGAVTSGSGGASVTPQQIDNGDTASAATVERNNTTAMATGSGSLEELEAFNWNVRVPFHLIYPPEVRPVITPGNRWTLELETAPADSINISGTLWFEEIG